MAVSVCSTPEHVYGVIPLELGELGESGLGESGSDHSRASSFDNFSE